MAGWERARSLILAYGWNANAYQILNPGFELWFDDANEAVVGYVTRVGMRVAAGAPVCPPENLAAAVGAFEAHAAQLGETACWFGAEARLERLLPGRALLWVGSQPVWDPQEWRARVGGIASLRAQLNRARNKGVRVSEWQAEAGADRMELQQCLRAWLASRGLPPLHFLVESRALERPADRRLFVAEHSGRVVGFVLASPVPAREGWLLEQVVRHPDAPNGTTELLIDRAARELAENGASYLTLGLAPLARLGRQPDPCEPFWLRLLLGWARAHGRRFYDFRGLEFFKSKFRPPRWDPVYVIEPGAKPSPRTLYAVAAAFSDGAPVPMLLRGLWRAARQEIGDIGRRFGP